MEGGNDVDLSNNNITPRWKKRPVNGAVSSRPNPRPLSGQTAGVLTEDKSAFTLSQPAEKIVASPGGPAVLKHVLNKPSRKARVVRSISIGHLSNGRFTLSKLKSEGDKPSTDNRAHHDVDGAQTGNGVAHRQDRRPPCDRHRDVQKRLSSPMTLTSQTDQIVFGSSPSDTPLWKTSSPTNSYGHLSPPNQPPEARSHSPSSGTPSHPPSPPLSPHTPSHTHSPHTPSIPTPPRTPSDSPTHPAPPLEDRDVVLLRQTSGPSQGPDSKPQPTFVLSTHSPVAQKMGTQQLIPRGLASDVRLCKTAQGNHGNHGNVGQLEPSKRALRAISMVETGSYFSTGWGDAEVDPNGDGDGDSPGMLRRGLRSTSYRRAVVSGVDMEVPKTDPKAHRLSQPVLRGLPVDKEQPSSPGKGKSNEKKKGLQPQRTFDNEEDEVLYQNYKEKALHNDSDEDAEAREPKPDDRIVVQYRPIRTSWSQLSVVKKSGISQNLTPEERKRQEAIFEVISSEHSYLHSLEILVRMFKNSTELSDTMTKTESHHLFSNIVDVCEASKKFFSDLEDRHQQNFLIDDISDIVIKHAHSNFDPYVTYCSNEVYQQRTLQRLVTKNPSFKEVLTRIESHQDCRNLPMISFLILPMQRVTRLPLLMDTICQKTPKDSAHYDVCKKALQSVSKVVRQCNEGARRMERTEMMYTINSQLEFKIKPFPLVSSSRWMVKRGELTAFVEENGIFLKRTSRQQVYFFLFNDVLIITRKKSEDSYAVMDYALRDQIAVGPCQAEDLNLSPVRTTAGMLTSRQSVPSHLFRLVFRSVHSGEKVPMVLGAELMNERARWISALGQSGSNRKDADRTNVMQVEIIRTYTARQPDELSLQVADVVLVSQAVEDGWYEGDRLRDGERGWFLAECAQKITCQATIEKNMQRMDRLQGLETNV
ncbi:rho guanine nucleotide exchange factor 26-like [Anguilla anguilla]|uniref:rho guanine nucleotide exchange factor 26-like n=1 Tax=Anguilla anguilla TaxID=7936 RepID=UPI0015AD4AC6|nr:rho guanine nucleotide exchange factor 26-like [Anguilla anguilla]